MLLALAGAGFSFTAAAFAGAVLPLGADAATADDAAVPFAAGFAAAVATGGVAESLAGIAAGAGIAFFGFRPLFFG